MFRFIFFLSLSFFVCLSAFASGLSHRLQYWDVPGNLPPLVFEDADGVQRAVSDFKGRFLLLNVWATWCPPCLDEMPSLDRLQQRFDPETLLVLPLSEDRTPDRAKAYLKAHRLTRLPFAFDAAGRALSAFYLDGLPTTLLIDPQGREIARLFGTYDWNSEEAVSFLRAQIDAYKNGELASN